MRSNHLSYLAKYFNELSTFPILLKSDTGRSNHLRFLTAKGGFFKAANINIFSFCRTNFFFSSIIFILHDSPSLK